MKASGEIRKSRKLSIFERNAHAQWFRRKRGKSRGARTLFAACAVLNTEYRSRSALTISMNSSVLLR